MPKLDFVKPDKSTEKAVMAFMDRFYAAGETVVNGCAGLDYYKDYDVWLEYLARIESGEEAGFVPSVVYMAKNTEGDVVGIVDIRPALPEEKMHFGHIGYSVVPGQRGKGCATAMLAWGKRQLLDAGVSPLVACCYQSNGPSRRVLEKGGFVESGRYAEEGTGKPVMIYKYIKE